MKYVIKIIILHCAILVTLVVRYARQVSLARLGAGFGSALTDIYDVTHRKSEVYQTYVNFHKLKAAIYPEATSAASAKNQFLSPKPKAADRPTLSHICCLCQNQFLNPKTKITYFSFPVQLHHHHIVVQRFDHLTKHIHCAQPER